MSAFITRKAGEVATTLGAGFAGGPQTAVCLTYGRWSGSATPCEPRWPTRVTFGSEPGAEPARSSCRRRATYRRASVSGSPRRDRRRFCSRGNRPRQCTALQRRRQCQRRGALRRRAGTSHRGARRPHAIPLPALTSDAGLPSPDGSCLSPSTARRCVGRRGPGGHLGGRPDLGCGQRIGVGSDRRTRGAPAGRRAASSPAAPTAVRQDHGRCCGAREASLPRHSRCFGRCSTALRTCGAVPPSFQVP